ncbi:MAG: lambda-exonuclease family protein [Candidatus Phytoplasma pyri]|uniref:lambda-exonuclease family protein n=1 Tax=Candidatus Phytoplasma pyri TaxID=47566 RepID=UPI003982FA05
MDKKEIQKNTKEFYHYRKNCINASEIGTIMGLNPYETKEELIKKKLLTPKFILSEAIEHGRKTKPKANLFFSIKMKTNYQPKTLVKDIFFTTLDGYDESKKTLLGIKCPFRPENLEWQIFFKKKIIQPYYWAQIQCQLYISESNLGYFLAFIDSENFQTITIKPDIKFIKNIIQEGKKFQELLIKYQNKFLIK